MRAHSERRIAVGIVYVVGALYVLSGPGRIDIIDGQIRYGVADDLLRRDSRSKTWVTLELG